MRDRAEELGIPLGLVNKAFQEQQGAIRERFARDQQALRTELQSFTEGNTFGVRLSQLNQQFAELRDRAEELGIPLREVNKAHSEAVLALGERVRAEANSLRLQLRQIGGEESVALQLALLDAQMRDLAKQAEELGVPLKLVTDAHRKAADAIRETHQQIIKDTLQQQDDLERQLRGQVRGIEGLFDNLIDPLKAVLANDNRIAPSGRIAQAQREFQETAALAKTGDVEAIRRLSGSASELQGLAQQYLGGGVQGSAIAREIEAALKASIGSLEQQRQETLASLPQVQRETMAELIRENKKDVQRVVDELEKVRKELETLRRAA
jgi:hypothetical protein